MVSIYSVKAQADRVSTVEEIIEILKTKNPKAKCVFKSPRLGVFGSGQEYSIDVAGNTSETGDDGNETYYVYLGSSSR